MPRALLEYLIKDVCMSVMLVTNPKSQTPVIIYVSPSAILNVLIDSGLHMVDNRYGITGKRNRSYGLFFIIFFHIILPIGMTDMLSGGYNTQGKVSPRNRKVRFHQT